MLTKGYPLFTRLVSWSKLFDTTNELSPLRVQRIGTKELGPRKAISW
jgi:hypothetical protein